MDAVTCLCAKQFWALLMQRAKLVAARDWRQSWSAMTMTYQKKVWLRRLSVAITKQEAIATLLRVPLVTRQAAMVWLCSVRARAEVRDTRVCVSLLLGTVGAAEADCRCLGVVVAAAACFSVWRFLSGYALLRVIKRR